MGGRPRRVRFCTHKAILAGTFFFARRNAGGDLFAILMLLTVRDQLPNSLLGTAPRLDVLVNNAGGGSVPEEVRADPFTGEEEDWDKIFALNLHAAIRTTRAALPALSEARGAVINVSSESALQPHTVPLPYSSAKAALNAFSRGLAENVAPKGVRVNVVTPSATRTDLLLGEDGFVAHASAALGVDEASLLEALPQQVGLVTGRLIDPSEIARAIVLLSSPTMPSAVGSNWAVHAGVLKMPA